MKDLVKSWKFWVAVTTVVLIIVGVILYFTIPQFKVVVWEIAAGILLVVAGFIAGYLIGKKVVLKAYAERRLHKAAKVKEK